ncbi:hypothetical protein [Mammaliicoccus lentus]|uniref:hypothetical protein n=1 Tax=Mammaliicoccus lentus TaxID=42858 RepID=UPI00264916A2|nr:hypothetical protein [Mammaliicoccus lentus]
MTNVKLLVILYENLAKGGINIRHGHPIIFTPLILLRKNTIVLHNDDWINMSKYCKSPLLRIV